MIEVYPKVRQHHEKDEPAPFRMKRARAVGLKEGFSQSGRNWRSPMVKTQKSDDVKMMHALPPHC